jgi:hypothetical protein
MLDAALKKGKYSLPLALAKRIVMTDKSLLSFSVAVSLAVKKFKRSDGINQLRNKKCPML